MTPRAVLPMLLGLLAAGAGCLDAAAPPLPGPASWTVLPPVALTSPGPGAGFEPSIEAAPDGTLFATAAKGARLAAMASGQLADWAWWSGDGGLTWQAAESPRSLHRSMPGLEGDAAVDAAGRVYYADTFGPDYFLHRWSTGPDGLTWDWSRPVPTLAFLDDRPWLAAHGEGILYLLSNTGAEGPVAGDLARGDATASSKWLFTSQDGGETWSLGAGLGPAAFCEVAASPADDRTAWIGCSDGTGPGAPFRLLASGDRGASWDVAFRGVHERGHGYLSVVPVADRSGKPALAWLDDRVDWSGVQTVAWGGDQPGRVLVARPDPLGAWQVRDVTPFPGRFGMVHACAGGEGHVAVVFYSTPDLSPGASSQWTAYALVFDDIDAAAAPPHLVTLLEGPAAVGAIPPRDLFQCAVDPDGTVHTVVQRNRQGEAHDPGDGIRADVLHVAARRALSP
jgi:hypothetical protein